MLPVSRDYPQTTHTELDYYCYTENKLHTSKEKDRGKIAPDSHHQHVYWKTSAILNQKGPVNSLTRPFAPSHRLLKKGRVTCRAPTIFGWGLGTVRG